MPEPFPSDTHPDDAPAKRCPSCLGTGERHTGYSGPDGFTGEPCHCVGDDTAAPIDLTAARADIATVAATDGRVYGIDGLEEVRAAQAAAYRLAGLVPDLLAAVDRVRAMCAFLAERPALGGDSAASLVLAALENRAPEEADRG